MPCTFSYGRCMVKEEEATKASSRAGSSAALRIASWTLVSRLLGLFRDRLMFGVLGRGMESSAFLLAWTLPNMFRRLLGEGALTAAFVPLLTKRHEQDGLEAAKRSLSVIMGSLLLLLSILLLLAVLVVYLLPISSLSRGEGEDYAVLLKSLLFILLPYLLPVCLMALSAAALQVMGSFSLPAAAPVVLNLFWIGGILWVSGKTVVGGQTVVLAGFLLAGGLCQFLMQLVGLWKKGMLSAPRLDFGDADLRQLGRNMLPMLLGLSIVQFNVLAQQLVAVYMVPQAGANSVMFLAQRLLEFPHALLGIALGTAVFPLLARLGTRGELGRMGATLTRALSMGVFLALPAAAGLFALAPWILELLFVTGRFQSSDAAETAKVIRVLAFSLPGLVLIQLLARAHYALQELKIPVRISVSMFLLALILSILLAPRYGTFGLALASSISVLGNALLLLLSMARLGHGSCLRLGSVLRALLASGPTAFVASWLADEMAYLCPAESGLVLRLAAILLLAGLVVFMLIATILRADEMKQIRASFTGRASLKAPPSS